MSGSVLLSLTNPAAFTSIFRVDIKAALRSTGLTNDTVSIYGQVFALDLITPLTGEVLLATRTANTTATVTVTAPHEGYGTATAADWNGARLRLRWEYAINANEEAIRLDPSIPSLAVGNPLPTGYAGGGNGLWVGVDAGFYKMRLGTPTGVGLHWTGAAVELRNSTGAPTITLDASGNSRFDGAMTIGAAGGIWQGTGTFASPATGLKLYNSDGVGRLSTYNGGLEQVTINTAGQLVAGAGKVMLDRSGVVISGIVGASIPALRFATGTEESTYGYLDGGSGGVTLGLKGTTVLNGPRLAITRDGLWLYHRGLSTATLYVTNGAIVADFENGGVFSVNDRLATVNEINVGTGLAVGSQTVTPDTGAIHLHARTSTVTPWPGGVQLWAQTVSGVQKLYVKFGNGTVRELASA